MENNNNKAFSLISMLTLTALLLSYCTAYKVTVVHTYFGDLKIVVAIFTFPLIYFFTDIVTEVYGAEKASEMVRSILISATIFSVLVKLLTLFGGADSQAFTRVLGDIWQFNLGLLIGLYLGSKVNIFLVTKLAESGRVPPFWLRSIYASCVGEFVTTVTAEGIQFYNHLDKMQLIHQMAVIFTIKVIYAVALASIISKLAHIVRIYEKHNSIKQLEGGSQLVRD